MVSRVFIIFYCLLLKTCYFCAMADTSRDADKPDCKVFYTFGYVYNTFFQLPESSFHGNELTMKFMVRAKSDAHVLLATSNKNDPTQPVYEIVIGGGKNTFSEIRRSRIGGAKSTTSILNLLSATEPRGFWIRITHDGIIEVGKEDEEDNPFMYWKDSNPLPIKYFSFSTWTDVFGKWFFDCNTLGKNDTSTVVKKSLTWTERLRDDLLKDYDPQVIPKRNLTDRLVVNTRLECHHIHLDFKKSEITVMGLFGMSWMDEKLKWNPSAYGGIKSIQLIHGEIWRPELVLYNAVDNGAEPLGISGALVNALGEVKWSPLTRLQAHCKLDLRSWPWDEHTCELKLGFWALKDFLKIALLKEETELSKQRTTSEWKILSIEAERTTLDTPWFNKIVSSIDDISENNGSLTQRPADTAMVIKITVKRVSNIYTFVLLIPLVVNAIVCFISFHLSPIATEKIGIQCVCLLLGSMFIITVDNLLPSTVDHVPYILNAFSMSVIMVSISTAASVLIMTMIRQPHFKPPHHLLISILDWSPLRLLLCLPEVSFDGLHLLDEPNNEELKPEKPSHYWDKLATVLDRILFIVITIGYVYLLAGIKFC